MFAPAQRMAVFLKHDRDALDVIAPLSRARAAGSSTESPALGKNSSEYKDQLPVVARSEGNPNLELNRNRHDEAVVVSVFHPIS